MAEDGLGALAIARAMAVIAMAVDIDGLVGAAVLRKVFFQRL